MKPRERRRLAIACEIEDRPRVIGQLLANEQPSQSAKSTQQQEDNQAGDEDHQGSILVRRTRRSTNTARSLPAQHDIALPAPPRP